MDPRPGLRLQLLQRHLNGGGGEGGFRLAHCRWVSKGILVAAAAALLVCQARWHALSTGQQLVAPRAPPHGPPHLKHFHAPSRFLPPQGGGQCGGAGHQQGVQRRGGGGADP